MPDALASSAPPPAADAGTRLRYVRARVLTAGDAASLEAAVNAFLAADTQRVLVGTQAVLGAAFAIVILYAE